MVIQRTVEAWVFDAYGTMFDVASVITVCQELYQGTGQRLSQLWRAKQLEYTWLLSLMKRYEDFWQVTEKALSFACQELGVRCGPSERTLLMDAYLRLEPYTDVAPALRGLSHYPLAILSNGSPAMLEAIVENAGLTSFFHHIMSVEEAGVYKPSPRAYRLASQNLELRESAIGFVSANSWDVIGAKSFGFWACWLNRSGATLDELGFRPDATVTSLTDLVG